MKEKINGHIYDTDTAKKIAHWCEGLEEEGCRAEYTYYRTRSGQWFMHYENTHYYRTYHEVITPLPEAEATEDIKRHMDYLDDQDKRSLAKALLGSIGGSKKTQKKAAAARKNGQKGGRPRKKSRIK